MTHNRGSRIFTCSKCGKTFKKQTLTSSCLVMHPEGQCCHYGLTEVSDLATTDPEPTTDTLKSAHIREAIEEILDDFGNSSYQAGKKYGYQSDNVRREAFKTAHNRLESLISKVEKEARIDEVRNSFNIMNIGAMEDRLKELEGK